MGKSNTVVSAVTLYRHFNSIVLTYRNSEYFRMSRKCWLPVFCFSYNVFKSYLPLGLQDKESFSKRVILVYKST